MPAPCRKHRIDPWPVIAYAVRKAIQTGQPKYVKIYNSMFTYSEEQPAARFSHWMADTDGNVFAHLAKRGVVDHKYEACNIKPVESD